jgi:hypothetical protein
MGKKIKLDFSNVKDGFTKVNKPGTYTVKITKVEAKKGKNSGKPYLNWELQILEGEFKDSKLWYKTSLQPQALFNLRDFLTAAGIDVPKKVVSIDLDSVIGRVVAAKVKEEEYKGEVKYNVNEVVEASANKAKTDDELLDMAADLADEDDDLIDDEIDLDGIDLDE